LEVLKFLRKSEKSVSSREFLMTPGNPCLERDHLPWTGGWVFLSFDKSKKTLFRPSWENCWARNSQPPGESSTLLRKVEKSKKSKKKWEISLRRWAREFSKKDSLKHRGSPFSAEPEKQRKVTFSWISDTFWNLETTFGGQLCYVWAISPRRRRLPVFLFLLLFSSFCFFSGFTGISPSFEQSFEQKKSKTAQNALFGERLKTVGGTPTLPLEALSARNVSFQNALFVLFSVSQGRCWARSFSNTPCQSMVSALTRPIKVSLFGCMQGVYRVYTGGCTQGVYRGVHRRVYSGCIQGVYRVYTE